MAILIPDMEMPETCINCPCLDDEYWLCKVTEGYDEPLSYCRPDWCPLVEVPKRPRYDAELLKDCGMEE